MIVHPIYGKGTLTGLQNGVFFEVEWTSPRSDRMKTLWVSRFNRL